MTDGLSLTVYLAIGTAISLIVLVAYFVYIRVGTYSAIVCELAPLAALISALTVIAWPVIVAAVGLGTVAWLLAKWIVSRYIRF
ncbi:MAG: hypothetical protein CUN55_16700 [Phototrophicales bacterium]|nr:MAG: hypothetical protein CUN55_16700 [Phototrophicales bacterium]